MGTVKMSGAKNAVLPVLAATLLTEGRNVIDNVPEVRDVLTMIKLLEALGAEVENYSNEKIILDTSPANEKSPSYCVCERENLHYFMSSIESSDVDGTSAIST